MKNEFVMVPREPTAEMLAAAKKSGVIDPRVSGYCYELMVAAAPKHQGEPVAWRGINELGEVVTDWVDGVPPASMVDLCGNPASFAKIERAYTHADPGEVERLRADRDDLQRYADELNDERCGFERKIDTLRAQLAERDALQPKMIDLLKRLLDSPHTFRRHICNNEEICELINALSASAEPSAPTEEDYCPDGIVGGAIHGQIVKFPSAPVEIDELTDEQIIEAMRSYLNDADGGYVVDTAPDDVVKTGRALLACARRGAPVEIDERAEFDAAYERGDFYLEEQRSEFKYQDYRRHQAWAVWKVRAALERKP